MKIVKLCYGIKYYLKKMLAVEVKDYLYEDIVVKYYKTIKKKRVGVNCKTKRKRKVIVSMTSIPDRIDKVWITVESLLRQTYRPDKIVLWLAEDEFKGYSLPNGLMTQQNRGLEIRYCENLRSYKKYYYAAKENPLDYIITVDDDIIYSEDMIEKLLKTYKKNPECIVCNRSHKIKKKNGKLCAYNKWIKYEDRIPVNEKPSFANFFTSGGGTLFPMFKMDRIILDKDTFLKLAPYADDVWLNFSAWKSNLKIINTKGLLGYIITVESSAKKGLFRINVNQRKNDEQIRQALNYFNFNIDQFIDE